MEWRNRESNEQLFWHITNEKSKKLIESDGIIQSKDGQNGKGVYCIEAKEYDVLDSIVELMESNGENVENLMIVEFKYTGMYKICDKNLLINSNEGWAVIKGDIDKSNIIRIEKLNDM